MVKEVKIKSDTDKYKAVSYVIAELMNGKEVQLVALGGAIPKLCSIVDLLNRSIGVNCKLQIIKHGRNVGLKALLKNEEV